MEMIVGIAGDRGVHQISRPVRTVLDGEGRARRVMGERHPGDLAGLGALLPRVPLPSDAEIVSGAAERVVACGMDGVADELPLGLGRGELGGERDRLMGGKDEIEAGVLSDMLAPVGAVVGPARLEQGVEFAVARLGVNVREAQRRSDPWREVWPPVRALAPAGVVGGEPFAGFEITAVKGDAVDLEGFGLGPVLGHISADQRAFAGGGDFREIEHGQARPATSDEGCAASGSRRVTISRVWRMSPARADCWVISRDRRSARLGPSCSGRSGVSTSIIWPIRPDRVSI